MDAEDRRRGMLERVRSTGSVDVVRLAEEFAVSRETVRRDLNVLEDHGLVRRRHGGVHPVAGAAFETALATRAMQWAPEKTRIAAAAAELLNGAETVFIDEGFTPQLIAEALPRDRPLTIVTPSLAVVSALATSAQIDVLLLGGRVRQNAMATGDHWAVRMLSDFVIDLAYLDAHGISRTYGLTTPDPAVGQVKAQAVRAARRRVFAGVHTTFGPASFCRFGDVSDLEAIVTGTGLPVAEAHRYQLLGPKVIRV
ncbi:DeoR/GlpR family DNA-binding transcription regulator [Streptomyces sp. NPDC058000]|uniref:DeoR/GlpR family DNA-binding transcription regulator n=1 Tax=Streptomyces sp. NPDC058000 TaxID=3346299 RepID=UPI0036E58438